MCNRPRQWVMGGWMAAIAVLSPTAWAADTDTDTDVALPPVTVTATPVSKEASSMAPLQSSNRITPQALARRQADAVFTFMDEVPGVSVQGGARNSGKRFAIRGHSDNEDVRVEVDGVSKGFEKYRFGGTFIEPDMLKTIEVRRGAQIESGAGAIGGTVSATTKDASDLLRPGQRWGARTRISHASNNQEGHAFVSAYGRFNDTLSMLAARTRREGNDIRLPDGRSLPLSATHVHSDLLKASWWATDAWKLSLSWLRYADRGLQAYDATGGANNNFGRVQRRIDDETLSLRSEWRDEAAGHEWTTTLGHSRTRVRDHFEPNWSPLIGNNVADDDVDYRQQTLDSRVRRRLLNTRDGWLDLHLGLQMGTGERSSRRVTSNAATNEAIYPGGYNRSQPPGDKNNQGAYVQLAWHTGRWQLMPGLRHDRIGSAVRGDNAEVMRLNGQHPRIAHAHTAPHLTIAFDLVPQRWTLFAQAVTGFRPALLDEAFTRGGYGRCTTGALKTTFRQTTVPGYAGLAVQGAPTSQICGDLYRNETSRGVEAGVNTRHPALFGQRSLLRAKLTAFHTRTDHLLESLMAQPGGSGQIVQPGRETRQGLEAEAELELASHFVRLSGSRLHGEAFDGLGHGPLLTAPGHTWNISLGWRPAWGEAVLRWHRTGSQHVELNNTTFGRQAGYHLLSASLNWRINTWLDLGLSGENLLNTPHLLPGGQGPGAGLDGPGRNLRLSLGARY